MIEVWPYDILHAMAGRHQASERQVFGGIPKVPAVKPYFWVVKLLTTAMGEAVSDFLVKQYNEYLAVLAAFVVFAIAIVWQFRTPGYRTWPYWSAVAMVAVFGTMCADAMHIALHVPYKVSATFFAVCLVVVFVTWYRAEGTLDIHSIVTPRREVFYWLAVIFTFAMGTALGDLTATTFGLGYLTSAFLFIGLILIPLVAWRMGANPVLTFWVAYILTRPIGASFADFFGMPKTSSGMGFGHEAVSAVTIVLVIASFVYLSRSGIDKPEAAPAVAPAPAPARAFDPGRRPEQGYYQRSGYPQAESYAQQPGYSQQPGYPQQGYPQRTGYDPRYEDQWNPDPRYADPGHADGYGQPEPPGRLADNQRPAPPYDQR
jgi:uncharacterized membrane-anchored protein